MADRLELRLQEFLTPGEGKILLVGDKPGPGSLKEPAGTIFVPFRGTNNSSKWLNDQLDAEQIPENCLTWLNVFYFNDVQTPVEDILKRKPAHIVALGGIASSWLKRSNIETFYKVPHPQFWKRFKSKQRYPLLDILIKLTGATK